ncbi:hypothetical protein [Hyperthermus butylicus]|uniref:Uncharacterized protein n=1 Tax=Hyperthermus butylicus (strain DSM 5456 / JCM 9403 / PLM1-5) TaxID=415426 RepID=A2BJ55_HYPBU|nr:hypothetical protein [Hyperthermus butylicus]ABM80016.1 hypothetical protein Hbut_0144 [Hyperthermus butylicus DSM 5456]
MRKGDWLPVALLEATGITLLTILLHVAPAHGEPGAAGLYAILLTIAAWLGILSIGVNTIAIVFTRHRLEYTVYTIASAGYTLLLLAHTTTAFTTQPPYTYTSALAAATSAAILVYNTVKAGRALLQRLEEYIKSQHGPASSSG